MGLLNEPKTLNPFLASDAWARKVLRHIYMPILIYEPEELRLVPWLAAEDPHYDAEGKTAVVKLKKAKWSDGTEFTAHDVVFTAEVIQEFKIPRHRSRWEMIEKVEALDDHTLRYTFKKPSATFESRTLTSLIVQKKSWLPVVEKARSSKKPLTYLNSHQQQNPPSLGPFYLAKWTQGNSILLLRNKHFFARNSMVEGLNVGPYIDGILFKIYGTADASILALKKGDVDGIGWSISPGYVEDLQKDPNITIFSNTKSGYNYIGFNCRKPPFNHKEFRQAMATLIDKDFLVKRVLQGRGIRRDNIVPPGSKFWYNPDITKYGVGLSTDERFKKAYELLKKVGWTWEVPPVDASGKVDKGKGITMPDGKVVEPFDFLTPPADYDPNRAISAMLISDWFNKFGVPVSVRPMAFNAMLQKVKSERKFDMFVLGWRALSPDPGYLGVFFHSKSDRKNGRNMEGYHNKAFDELADSAEQTLDRKERREKIFKLQEILAEDCPVVPLFAPNVIEAARKGGFSGWVSAQDGIDNLWTYLLLKPVK